MKMTAVGQVWLGAVVGTDGEKNGEMTASDKGTAGPDQQSE